MLEMGGRGSVLGLSGDLDEASSASPTLTGVRIRRARQRNLTWVGVDVGNKSAAHVSLEVMQRHVAVRKVYVIAVPTREKLPKKA